MSELPGAELIGDDELLYRRIPASSGWYDRTRNPPLEPEAFRPNKKDTSGISLSREKHTTVDQAARGRPGKSYYLALLRAGDIRAAGMSVVPMPVPGDPGHAEIPELTYESRKSRKAIEWRTVLAEKLCVRIIGPFPQRD